MLVSWVQQAAFEPPCVTVCVRDGRPALRLIEGAGQFLLNVMGEDPTALGFMAHGGRGCISVTANVAPALCAEFQSACLDGDYAAAIRLQDRLMPLHVALFVETSPGPVKYAAHLLGLCEPDLRLPMAPVAETTRAAVRSAMIHAGLLNA